MGRSTPDPTREELLSAEDVIRVQRPAWSAAYRYAYAHSPFYREHFRRAGLTPEAEPALEEIGRIPTVDKRVVSERTMEFLCVPERRVIDIVTTSGSTGQPLITMLTEADMERLALNELLSFRCAGFTADDKVLLAVAMDRCFIAGMAYFLGLRKLGCSILRVGSATPAMHLDMLGRAKPTAIVGVPSFIGLLADKAAEAGMDVRKMSVRKVVCIGEPLRNADFSPNRAGLAIQERYGARVFSTYGNTELQSSLCECEAGAGGHLHPALLHVEALDEKGRAVPEGEVGELTATTFGVEGMPLVRYRTGDYATIHTGVCACGLSTPRLGPILSRKDHKLKLKGTTIFPSTLKAVLDRDERITSYVIIARKEGELSDAVEIKLACSGDGEGVRSLLRERLQGEAKVAPALTLASAEEIERLQLPEGARKRRYFVDLRQSETPR